MSLPTLRVGGGMAAAPAAQGRAFSPLSDAVVLLRAATAALDGWTAAARWRNEGTGGTTYDGVVGDLAPTLTDGAFVGTASQVDATVSMFEIADGDIWNPTIGTDGLTIAWDWEPISSEPTRKSWWHYTGVDIATAGYGMVAELLNIGGGSFQAMVFSTNDLGPGNPSNMGIAGSYSTDRCVYVARIGPGSQFSLFRNGTSIGTFDATNRGPIADHVEMKLANLGKHYAFAAWDRAVSNADIALLSAGFPVVP